ncbi:adenosine deaminase [Rhizoctonia solani AG-1 IA]|uniref:Adenosine deaminase n=1 Tax=Thanatephorus cucumeris (strain AG1-IA) TaxID=983506 RepID=L8WXT2_THACA|nr:adenosine deaminase [Rhizoctonia solani AG-1 IA]
MVASNITNLISLGQLARQSLENGGSHFLMMSSPPNKCGILGYPELETMPRTGLGPIPDTKAQYPCRYFNQTYKETILRLILILARMLNLPHRRFGFGIIDHPPAGPHVVCSYSDVELANRLPHHIPSATSASLKNTMHLSLSTIRSLGGLQLLVTLLCTRSVGAVPTSSNLLRRNGTLPSIYEYLQQRADLIAEERAIRFDAGFIKNATDKELRAMKIVDALRLREQQAIWFADPDKEPGMPFLWAKDTIDAKRGAFTCPFGCHRGRTLFAPTCIGLSQHTPTHSIGPLSQDEADQYVNNSFPTSPYYVPNSWVSALKLREGFPGELGGKDGFDKWIINAMTISADDTYIQYNTTAKGLTRYEPIYRRYVDQLLVSQVEDGISYVEIRLGYSPTRTVISEDGTRNLTNSEVLDITQSIIDGVKARLQEQGRGNEFIGARRSLGFDMAGQEDPGHPLVFFAEALLDFRSKAEKRGLDIPFMFHAGETLDDGGEVDSNLYDAFLLGAKRIGHGFSLAKHPLLMQKYRENGIAVEICPISNELLRLTRSANTHILPILLNNGVPVALSSDDPAVFQNPGLSFDFYQAIVASNITNILSLGKIARQSLEFSSLNNTAKAAALDLWDERWYAFIDGIVASDRSFA